MIPVIDIFAGPGGLGEGFSALLDENNERVFRIALSIEKDPIAHQTLTLRSFFRQFDADEVPLDYYDFVKGKITLEKLFEKWPVQAQAATQEAWLTELGAKEVPNTLVDIRITAALQNETEWLLIGGPPCQAYSIVGRSRNQITVLDGRKDKRVRLYKQYLRILAFHNPAVFIMENVKGLLSAETNNSSIFSKILKDLANPVVAYESDFGQNGGQLICPGYKIYSLVAEPEDFDEDGNPVFDQKDFVIKTEDYGVPQARHRIILLGIRNDINFTPDILDSVDEVPISKVLSGLPKLRSGLSKIKDSDEMWETIVKQVLNMNILQETDERVKKKIREIAKKISAPIKGTGLEFIKCKSGILYKPEWFLDANLEGVCNHVSRGHMESDIYRYFFASSFSKVHKCSPRLEDFPEAFLPAHKNVANAHGGLEDKKFVDRFKVQLWNQPSKTITSHISKDGHYYIHPDPKQCRSFTVREAARIQTFPDNYFFCGPRTSQFIQVGNAVPPLLAHQIARTVKNIFMRENIMEINFHIEENYVH